MLDKLNKPLDCGHVCKPGEGVARDHEGLTCCQTCAETREVETFLAIETTRYAAYVSEDGKRITTWTGAHLAHIALIKPRRLPTTTGVTVWAFDSKRRWWYGVGGGRGWFIRIRQIKEFGK
jgi:hypothetical protein